MPLNKTVKLESLLKILRLLDRRVVLAPAQLSELLGVTERTVYRYITALQRAGYPIYFDKQKNSYRLMDGYKLSEQSVGNNELYQALSLKSRMTDALAVGLVSYNHLGQCVVANAAAALITGVEREMLLKENYHSLESWKKSGLALSAKSVMESGFESHGEYHLTTSFGKEVWICCSMSRFIQRGKPFLMLVFQDITILKTTEIRLRNTQKLIDQFLEYSPVYTFIKDEQSRPVMLSRNYEQLFHSPLKTIIGKRMDELLPEEIARRVVQEDLKVLESNEVFQEDDEINGRHYATTKFAIHHESGKSLGGFMVDVTERKLIEMKADELAAQLRAMADATLDALCLFSDDGTMLEVNDRACDLYGYNREDLLGVNRADLESDLSSGYFKESMKIIMKSGSYRYKTYQKRFDGTLFYAEVSAVFLQASRKLIEFTREITQTGPGTDSITK